jgi:hypothetical protein
MMGVARTEDLREAFMRQLLIASAFAFFALAPTSATAQERQYPWCARYDWTTSNCGFVSFNQCLATISGVGGRCEPNPRYVAAAPRAKKRYRQ